jgi:hypothetical protein
VALLTQRGKATISLVAEVDGHVAGHILFSPVTVGPTGPVGPGLPNDIALPNRGSAEPAEPTIPASASPRPAAGTSLATMAATTPSSSCR